MSVDVQESSAGGAEEERGGGAEEAGGSGPESSGSARQAARERGRRKRQSVSATEYAYPGLSQVGS